MKKTLYFFILVFTFFSCKKNKVENIENKKVIQPEFQNILNAKNVKGSVLIYDFKKETYYSNDFDWATIGFLPASTFKIPNSIILSLLNG